MTDAPAIFDVHAGGYAACERMRLDRLASGADQLAWLREAGFPDADCLYKDHGFAVLVARRSR
jgi:tRNA (cmo5U34)-methyltransferase